MTRRTRQTSRHDGWASGGRGRSIRARGVAGLRQHGWCCSSAHIRPRATVKPSTDGHACWLERCGARLFGTTAGGGAAISSVCRGSHGGFGCTIRSAPWCWIANGFRAFDNIFYNKNNIKSCVRSTVGTQSEPFRIPSAQSEPFRMRFAHFSRRIQRIQYKTGEIGGQTAVNLGTCHHFYILTLKDKVVKRCHSTIFKVSGGWDASVLPLYSSSSWQKITVLAN